MAPTKLDDLINNIRHSDDELERKRERVFALLKQYTGEEQRDVYRMVLDILFPTPECRAVEFTRWLPNGGYTQSSGPLGEKEVVAGVADALRFGVTVLDAINEEAASEVQGWADLLESIIEHLPERPTFQCAHCGTDCTSTYAMMDDWILCLTSSEGRPSCFTRVHDYGEALGSGRT